MEESIGRLIGKAKRIWKESKKEPIMYSDELSGEEASLFSDDSRLAELILLKTKVDAQIIQHIDEILAVARKEGLEEAKKYLFIKNNMGVGVEEAKEIKEEI